MPVGFYTANAGTIHKIRLSVADLAAQPTASSGPATSQLRAKVSTSSKAYGLNPRKVTLGRTIGTAPNTFVKYKHMAVLTAADLTTILGQATLAVGGTTYDVLGQTPERVR